MGALWAALGSITPSACCLGSVRLSDLLQTGFNGAMMRPTPAATSTLRECGLFRFMDGEKEEARSDPARPAGAGWGGEAA